MHIVDGPLELDWHGRRIVVVHDPRDLDGFLEAAEDLPVAADWMVCAFGRGETAALAAALAAGGKARVGFENSLWHTDGSLASIPMQSAS